MLPEKNAEACYEFENKKVDLNLRIRSENDEISTYLTSYDLDAEREAFNENNDGNLNWEKLEYNPDSKGTKFECNYAIESEARRFNSDVDRSSIQLFNHKYRLRDLSHAIMYLAKLNASQKAKYILIPNRKFENEKELTLPAAPFQFCRRDYFIFKKMLQLHKLNDIVDQSFVSLFISIAIVFFLFIDLLSEIQSLNDSSIMTHGSIDFIASFYY
jgi:hypothetical protein